MTEEQDNSPSASPAAPSLEPPAAAVADVVGPESVESAPPDAQTFSSPLGDLVNAYFAERDAQGAPTAEAAFAKYRERRQANADAFAAFVNGTGPFPFEGRRF